MHFNLDLFLPLARMVASAAASAAAFQLWRLAGHAVSSIRDQQVRDWATTLIHAAESSVTAPQTGDEKKAWVIDRVRRRFPSIPLPLVSDLVEGLFQGSMAAQGK